MPETYATSREDNSAAAALSAHQTRKDCTPVSSRKVGRQSRKSTEAPETSAYYMLRSRADLALVKVNEAEITEKVNGHINGKVDGSQRASAFAEGARIVPKSLSESTAATKAEYRKVGNSGLRVSNPIMGTLGFGDRRWLPWCLEEEEASQLLFAAYTKGITTWDTANAYSNGVSEEIIGRTIKRYNIPRRKLVLMTKVGRIVAHPDDSDPGDFVAFLDDLVGKSKDYTNQYAIFNAVEQSLERLQTSYIDVLHIHRYDDTVPPEETMPPIIGMNSVERMDEALAIRGMELSAEEEAYLEEAYEPKRIQGHA
ncbi:hypothetical protein DL766_007979 [Monosporascus sp. MC13-8B]|uniref:NADP-dependent oxidoreductase domain-containing protein n=1 Tax=Monosporascus cannonballus TaxID=155416 RepID=A0ABY0H6A5_9PEZI|nr:hypothetical protein DL762_006432 [Monosporascus cannonballus]RYO85998.1 hypothetical protein DL763_006868 [Monosporascus cannonballus]RYP21294.1 hypothetical protein DL766_007979 [Monosporascus sp. MC13-8B]